MSAQYDYRLKIIFMGDASVGKTSLLTRFVANKFSPGHVMGTIGASFFTRTLSIENQTLRLELWDTAGQERYHSFPPIYYRGAHAVIFMYDITNPTSFENLERWTRDVEDLTTETLKVVIGNKTDLRERKSPSGVPTEEGRRWAESKEFLFFEASAKNGSGVHEPFEAVARESRRCGRGTPFSSAESPRLATPDPWHCTC